MPDPSLLLLLAIPGLIGAGYLAYEFRRLGRPATWGAAIGAATGALGPLIFMLPLNFCTFEAGRKPLDMLIGGVLVAAGAALALEAVKYVVRVRFTPKALGEAQHQQQGIFRGWLTPFLLLAPTLVILVLFLYYPAIDNFRLSTLLARLGTPRTAFVCVDNFTRLFHEDYYQVVFNTLVISTGIVVFGLLISLAIAYLAFQQVTGIGIYRTLLIWPYAVSPAVAGIIFLVMFDPVAGVINHFIELLGGTGLQWIKDPWLGRFTIVAASIWKMLGYNVLFYLAGLQNVPKDLLEAAAIDGANAWQRFRRVTIPSLSPITFFLIVTNVTYAFFDIFGTIDFLTKGGPAGATKVMIYEIYELGILEYDLGKAAAQSIVLFLLVIGLTVLQFRTTGQRVTYGA